jgi:hypothetical protein
MANAAKAKGTRWETAVVRYLRDHWGVPARRAVQEGRLDVGDIHGVEPFILQAKDYTDTVTGLRVGTDGAVVQARNAGEDYGAAVVKRARASVSRAYVAMTAATFARLLLRLRRAETALASYAPAAYAAHREATEADLNRED